MVDKSDERCKNEDIATAIAISEVEVKSREQIKTFVDAGTSPASKPWLATKDQQMLLEKVPYEMKAANKIVSVKGKQNIK